MNKQIDKYILKQQIGSGQFGAVFQGLNTFTSQLVAVKQMPVSKFTQIPKLGELTQNEIKNLKSLNNINVIKFIEMIQTQNNVYLVYEYCNDGTLDEYLNKKQNRQLNETESLNIIKQLVNGYKSLYEKTILHRDLKPSNILVDNNIFKIADFGFCKSLMHEQDLATTMIGSPVYMAPEALKGDNYNIKADMWSMGILFFEIIYGYCPYEDKTIQRLIAKIDTSPLSIPSQNIHGPVSQSLVALIRNLLTINPHHRFSFNQLLDCIDEIDRQNNLNQKVQTNQYHNHLTIQQSQQMQSQQMQSQQMQSQPPQIQSYQPQIIQNHHEQPLNENLKKVMEQRQSVGLAIKNMQLIIQSIQEQQQQQYQQYTLVLWMIQDYYKDKILEQISQIQSQNYQLLQEHQIVQQKINAEVDLLIKFIDKVKLQTNKLQLFEIGENKYEQIVLKMKGLKGQSWSVNIVKCFAIMLGVMNVNEMGYQDCLNYIHSII